MIKKLSKYGNSFAILVDKPILELLNITETTKFRISTDGERLIIEPIREQKLKDEKLQELYEKFVEKYAPALEKLAKT